MEQFTRDYFGMKFRLRFLDSYGDNFQIFFGSIMNLRYPGDFTQTRPWGSMGDYKCDGYLPSRRNYYQCYAPFNMSMSDTLAKLKDDFAGALPFQHQYFDRWFFVHNSHDGRLPTWLSFELQKLRNEHQHLTIGTIGYYELLEEALSLDIMYLVDLFGPLLTLQDFLSLEFKDIIPVLNHVSSLTIEDSDPVPVSPQKLQFNRLSDDVKEYLKHGMVKANFVKEYLDANPDKLLSSKVTAAFHSQYNLLKQQQLDPDGIFYGLRLFAQGQFTQEPKMEGAVLAVLAYLFEECDIFENPPILAI